MAISTAGAGVALVLILLVGSAARGLAVTPDSVSYLHAAGDLAAGRSPTDAHGAPFVGWPPLYPALIGGVSAVTDQRPADAARLLQTALVVALVAVFVGASRRLVPNPWLRVVGVLCLALGPPVLAMAEVALSELLFSVVVLAALWALSEARRSTTWRLVALAAGLAAAASLTRYLGVVVIGIGAAVVVPRPRRTVAFALLSTLPLACWLARNQIVEGTLTGRRDTGGTAPGDTLHAAAEAIGRWVVPGNQLPVVIGCLAVALVGLVTVRVARTDRTGPAPLPFCLFVGLYPATLVGLAAVVGFDRVDQRLLAPVWAPVVLVVLIALCDHRWSGADAPCPLGGRVLVAGTALWLLAAGAAAVQGATDLARVGGGYAATRWDGSALVGVAAELPPDRELASNAPFALAFRTGRTAVEADAARPGDHLAWFDDPERSRAAPAPHRVPTRAISADLGLSLRLERVVDDGRLFRVLGPPAP